MPDLVFVSYNNRDRLAAKQVALFLAAENLSVWLDEWQIQAGDSIVVEIERALEDCTHFLILWSSNASGSNWVRRELSAALTSAIRTNRPKVIPLRLDDIGLPPLLSDLSYLRFHGGTEEDRYEIVRAVTGQSPSLDFIKTIVRKYHEVIRSEGPSENDPFGGLTHCPECGTALRHSSSMDSSGEWWFVVNCPDCGWSDATQ